MSSTPDPPEALRHIQAELGQALAGLGLADSGSAPHSAAAPQRPTADPFPPGARIGRFSVLQRVGRGGQGDVYAAYDPQLDRRVAVKLIRTGHGDPVPNIRLMREAQALAQLDHPNVIRVHEAGTHGPAAYIVMEFKTSQSLARWLADGRRTWREILAKFLAAGRGLRAAHQKGIVHRDVKADNIFVDDHVGAVLGDFGLAFGLDDASSDETSRTLTESRRSSALRQPLTEKGQFPGTEGYIAPEAMSGRATARSDQYSFCVAVFHALFGVMARPDERRCPPRPGDNPPQAIVKALHRGLASAPDARFPDVDDLLAALAVEPRRRAGLVLGAALAVGAGAAWVFWPRAPDPCLSGARMQAEAVWNPERRAALAHGFATVDLPFAERTGQSFLDAADEYASRWTAARASTCATPSPAAETCLMHQRESFAGLLATYAAVDRQRVPYALEAAARLPDPSDCLRPERRAHADIPDHLRRAIDQAEWRIASGDFVAARREITALQRESADSPARARVLYLAGWLAGATEPDRQADALLEKAMHTALRSRDFDTFARAATYRLKTLTYDLGEPAEAAALEPWVESIASLWTPGSVADRSFRADFAEARGIRLDLEEDFTAAADQHMRALALRTELFGEAHPLVAKSHHNVAVTLSYREDGYDEAHWHYAEALKIRRKLLGETHPETLMTTFGLAQAECEHFAPLADSDPGVLRDCVDDLTAAVAIYQQHDTLDRRGLPRRAVTLANHAIDAGCGTCAESALDVARTGLAGGRDVDPREPSDILATSGKLAHWRGALAEAHANFVAGVALWERTDRREQAYFDLLGNAALVDRERGRERAATTFLLSRAPTLAGAGCPARCAYADVLDEHAMELGPARSLDELHRAARTAREGCT